MPFETVSEKVVKNRKIRVCAKCRCEIPDVVKNRQTINQVGSMGGSLATSIGGSMLVGSVLGPVGAIGGAIAGAVVGSRAGMQATDKACDMVEVTQNQYCESCKKIIMMTEKNNSGSNSSGQQQQPQIGSSGYSFRGIGMRDDGTGSGGGSGAANNSPPPVVAEAREKMQKGLSWIKDKASSVREKMNDGSAKKASDNNSSSRPVTSEYL